MDLESSVTGVEGGQDTNNVSTGGNHTIESVDLPRFEGSQPSPPIDKVPPEILGEIFRLLPPHRHWRTDVPTCQYLLTAVCSASRGWYAAALLQGDLWATLILNLDNVAAYNALTSGLAHDRLGRAGTTDRTLQLDSYDCDLHGDRVPEDWEEKGCIFANAAIADALVQIQRLGSIAIDCPFPRCLESLSGAILSCATPLDHHNPMITSVKSFAIAGSHWREWLWSTPNALSAIFREMSLTSLWLSTPSHRLISSDTFLDEPLNIDPSVLRQLTSLNLTCDWPACYLFGLLRKCPNLESLSIDLMDSYSFTFRYSNDHEMPVFLPKLKALKFNNFPVDGIPDLAFLHFPSVTKVKMVFNREGYMLGEGDYDDLFINDLAGSALGSFLRGDLKSTSTLQSLSIARAAFEHGVLFEVLKDLSSLVHLSLKGVGLGSSVFIDLTSPTCRLPHLKSLEISEIDLSPRTTAIVHEFAQARGCKYRWIPLAGGGEGIS